MIFFFFLQHAPRDSLVKTAPSPVNVKMVPAVIPSLEAAAVRLGSVETCARMVGSIPLSQKIRVFSFIFHHDMISESQNGSCVQAVLRASMESSATRSVTVPITGAATGPMEPVCVILDSTDASATSVSPSVLILPDSYITSLFSKIFWVDLRDLSIVYSYCVCHSDVKSSFHVCFSPLFFLLSVS